jgi:hypothetical protein
MKQVKTAKGRIIDMAALAKANEETRAVSPGNQTLNARGDRIDSSGNVIQTVQAKSRAVHSTTTAPERRKLSDAPTAPKKVPPKVDPVAEAEPESNGEVGRKEKTREDGTKYLEIEYADGSVETQELNNEKD